MSWYVAGDWGTSHLRLYRMVDGAVAERLDGPGLSLLAGSPADCLRSLLSQWDAHGKPDQIILSGMAGARGGLAEAPYVPCPAGLAEWKAGILAFKLDGHAVRIAPGLRRDTIDVIRGEDAQIFGAIARNAALGEGSRMIVLPGTHSKWVSLRDGVIRTFSTFVTGEMFALLSQRSTLVNAGTVGVAPEDEEIGRAEGLECASSGDLLGGLFRSRTAQLLQDRTADWARGYLSGLLIGAEVEAARQHGGLPDQVVVIGDARLSAVYAEALARHGTQVAKEDGDACAIAGLRLIHG